jgi:hypothetical protein
LSILLEHEGHTLGRIAGGALGLPPAALGVTHANEASVEVNVIAVESQQLGAAQPP